MFALAAAAALAGCAVGPDFRRPEQALPVGYTAPALPKVHPAVGGAAGETQAVVPGRDLPAQWWRLFRNAELDRLIRQALDDSPTLAAAGAALRQAEENLRARSGAVYYPALDASLSGARQKVSSAASGQPGTGGFTYGLYNASLVLSYDLDLFGGGRRELEELRSQVDYQRFQLEAAHLSLTANIVTTVVREASLRAQLATTREMLAVQEQLRDLVARQLQLGGTTRVELLSQESQVAQLRASLPLLEKELAWTRNQLAQYCARFPSQAGLPEFSLDQLLLPPELPLSLPSSLARQRPDIRAAEELLHAASARIGVATANLYPQITLSGGVGTQAATLGKLLSSGSPIWSLGAGLLQPLFRGGELTARRRAAIAAYDQATAQYRETILKSFQSVADVLQALDSDATALVAQAESERTARETLTLTRRQYEIGATNYLLLLNAQRQQQQASIALIQARAARLADSAALFQALGGGWWNREAGADAAQPAEQEERR
ncbi:efflux transporter outer membrane subunit [Pelobacter propionicus]|uniref:efflux transporter outer membrane subunit n=1 Tax=Pelobacter propionicus TaxID=29543 RepID=UPI000315223E|nr:efflux transporter outer membrane subunit [Pelobacter propionicus]